MFLLAAGFMLSLLGSLPPGLISLSVAQTSLTRGLAAALALATGAATAEFFQAWLAVGLSDWFMSHPAAERGFHWAAIPVFFVLGIHLLFFARPSHAQAQVAATPMHRQFIKGLMISVFNLLAIPYWFVYCGWLRLEGWWKEGLLFTWLFSLGVSIGTVCALGIYAWLGQLVLNRAGELAKYANKAIGLIFLALGMKTLYSLL